MKKTLFIFAVGLLMMTSAQAQNSQAEAEVAQQLTKTEKFVNSCLFYKSEDVLELKEGGLYVTATIITNLETNEKIGTMAFKTKVDGGKLAAGILGSISGEKGSDKVMEDAGPKELGYLDMDEIDGLIKALKGIIASTKEKSDFPYYINYITNGGINVIYSSEEEKVVFSREWNTVNRFGTPVVGTVYSPQVSLKSVAKTIDTLEKAKQAISANM